MKSKLLHEHSMAEYLYTSPELLEEGWFADKAKEAGDYLKGKFTNEEEFEGRSLWNDFLAVFRDIDSEREDHSDDLFEILMKDSMWKEVILTMRDQFKKGNVGPGERHKAKGEDNKYTMSSRLDPMALSLGADDEEDEQWDDSFEYVEKGKTVQEIFEANGVEWSKEWEAITNFVALSDETNQSEGMKEKIAKAAPMFGAGRSTLAKVVAGASAAAGGVEAGAVIATSGKLGMTAKGIGAVIMGAPGVALLPALAILGGVGVLVGASLYVLDRMEDKIVSAEIEASALDDKYRETRGHKKDIKYAAEKFYRAAFWNVELQVLTALKNNPRQIPDVDVQKAFEDAMEEAGA